MNPNDKARDEAITRADEHANPDWKTIAYQVGVTVARKREILMSEDIIAAMPDSVTTHELRAMGAVMRRLQKDEIITPLGSYDKSPSPRGHSRPSLQWVSLVYGE
jgi:hypothetical protein